MSLFHRRRYETVPDQTDTPSAHPAQTETAQPQEAEAPASADTTTLSVVAPFYLTSFTWVSEADDTLVIDRTGTAVPSGDADKIIAAAERSGITLTRK